jgi:hypothetical protein
LPAVPSDTHLVTTNGRRPLDGRIAHRRNHLLRRLWLR